MCAFRYPAATCTSNGAPATPGMWSHKLDNKVKRKVEAARFLQSAADMQADRERDEHRDSRKRKEAPSASLPQSHQQHQQTPRAASSAVCRDFQKPKGCTFPKCKYEHICSSCKRKGHGESTCRAGGHGAPEASEARDRQEHKSRKTLEANKTEAKSDSDTATRTDNYFFLKPGITYQFLKHYALTVFYENSMNNSTMQYYTWVDNRAGVELKSSF
jgi:hypothetical protein